MPQLPITRHIRAAVVLAASVAVLGAIALPGAAAGRAPLMDGSRAPSAAAVTVTVHAFLAPDATPARRSAAAADGGAGIAGSPAPCQDRTWKLLDNRPEWQVTYRWWFRARSTPADLSRRSTAYALRRGVGNIARSANDCGRGDRVSATAEYLGITARRSAAGYDADTGRPTCALSDGYSVIAFGRLPARFAGLTCIFSSSGRIIEADITLNNRSRWATSLASCVNASLIEAVATHEAGHAFGLSHVPEADHGRLTMSERLDGLCQNGESTLGKGDMLGLEEIY